MKEYYLPRSISDRKTWFSNFAKKLLANATKLSLTAAQTASIIADAEYFAAIVDEVDELGPFMISCTTYRDILWSGSEKVIGEFPTAPLLGAHTLVMGGIATRISHLVAILRTNPAMTDSIAQDLGIVGTNIINDFSVVKGDTKGANKNGHAYLAWTHQGTDAAHIKCDYDDGKGYVFVGTMSTTRFLDPHTPDVGKTVGYKYIIRYVVADKEVGVWSDPIIIAVTGMPPVV